MRGEHCHVCKPGWSEGLVGVEVRRVELPVVVEILAVTVEIREIRPHNFRLDVVVVLPPWIGLFSS